ncbi:hypothetical protein PPL_08287 [Heterostelium album PN500]|uniref:Uncharacterized protein n=1 Tax=Heterostelium pallidum (strain ATCC 26659 / Pp 5 / PN500) TaxID=670386 RepID=D3BHS3_HETP5|nr:hypothetical protein PPL_08287 [Heterostelium album PN500]EFA78823.1 hypothetical protein PPL_08287 [Heterostelium album PN500]|eukprot:XP_020430947.1 hypothetical protein PPL_08287 [Heterostelium album PN500]
MGGLGWSESGKKEIGGTSNIVKGNTVSGNDVANLFWRARFASIQLKLTIIIWLVDVGFLI